MQTFKDTETGQYWQVDDDVIVDDTSGAYAFYTAGGERLALPESLVPADIADMPAPNLSRSQPPPVTRYQLREAMRLTPWARDGAPAWTLFDAFDELLKRPTTPEYYRRAWDELLEFEVESATIRAAADALGMTQDQRLDLFELAAVLRA